jgi:hypothetical protein
MRRLGIGRMIYRAYHRPVGAIRDCIRAGGPFEQWKTVRGRRAMEQAAESVLAPLPPPPGDSPEVCLLTGATLWYQTAFFLHSLARFQPVRPVIYGDGTLDAGTAARLQRVVPFARLVSGAEIDERLERLLPAHRYPSLRRRRDELVLFRKIIDVHLGAAGWRLFCDSDMLVFHRPEFLMGWLRAPSQAVHMVDATRAYGYEMDLLHELAGCPVPDLVNTGGLGLRSDAIDWDIMEFWCRTLIERAGTHYYQEQALVALLLSRQAHVALPSADYLVLPREPEASECRVVLHHYVAESKPWYFRQNWRKVLPAEHAAN